MKFLNKDYHMHRSILDGYIRKDFYSTVLARVNKQLIQNGDPNGPMAWVRLEESNWEWFLVVNVPSFNATVPELFTKFKEVTGMSDEEAERISHFDYYSDPLSEEYIYIDDDGVPAWFKMRMLRFLLTHEFMHIVLDHVQRGLEAQKMFPERHASHDVLNIAADIAVNTLIDSDEFKSLIYDLDYAMIPSMFKLDLAPRLTFEDYLYALTKQMEELKQMRESDRNVQGAPVGGAPNSVGAPSPQGGGSGSGSNSSPSPSPNPNSNPNSGGGSSSGSNPNPNQNPSPNPGSSSTPNPGGGSNSGQGGGPDNPYPPLPDGSDRKGILRSILDGQQMQNDLMEALKNGLDKPDGADGDFSDIKSAMEGATAKLKNTVKAVLDEARVSGGKYQGYGDAFSDIIMGWVYSKHMMPWGSMLKRAITGKRGRETRSSYSMPSTNQGMKLGYLEKGKVHKRKASICVLLDTSGSMAPEDYTQFMEVLNDARRVGVDIHVTQWDYSSLKLEPTPLKKYMRSEKPKIKGGGGTDMCAGVKYLVDNGYPQRYGFSRVLVVTDGYTPYFTPSNPSPIPVIWAITTEEERLDLKNIEGMVVFLKDKDTSK